MTALSKAALTLEELAAALAAIGGFESRPAVAVAVSGGPDSLALMLLADRWARRHGGVAWGLTVDHGLRPESAAETRVVAGWLAARNIPHETLTWDAAKPASGIQEAAREARYRLLAEWCRRRGVLHLLTAHHREDQAETYLMRRRAGSGPDGLAAMSAVRELPGCRLVRPLLAVPRDRLAALLAAEGQPFLSDPSNANPAFERTRLRLSTQNQPLSRSAGEGGSGRSLGTGEGTGHRQVPHPPAAVPPVPPLPRCGRELLGGAETETRAYARKRIAREAVLDALVGRAVTLHLAGFAAIDAAAITGFDGEVVERLLARVAACIGGGRYPARRDRVSRLRNRLAATPQCARTLGGCRFVPWRGQILVMRELAAAAPPQRLQPGETVAWDRRFEARLIAEATGAPTLGYLGQGGERLTERYRSNVPRLLHSVLPALWDEQGLVAVPSVGYRRPAIEPLPCVWFHPANPLSRAGFTVV